MIPELSKRDLGNILPAASAEVRSLIIFNGLERACARSVRLRESRSSCF
jgi:hypothetical protein